MSDPASSRFSTVTEEISTDDAFREEVQWIWSDEHIHKRRTDGSPSHYEVRRFRRSLHVTDPSVQRLIVHASADSRYVLYLNGQTVLRGPAKGDVRHHFFESADLSEHLLPGENVLSALVMDYSTVATYPPELGAPTSIMTMSGGLLVQARLIDSNDSVVENISTDQRWSVSIDRSYRFQAEQNRYGGFVGYFEDVDFAKVPVGWRLPGFAEDKSWERATELYPALRYEEILDYQSPYGLMPRMIPQLELLEGQRFTDLFLHGGADAPSAWEALVSRSGNVAIPPRSSEAVVLDAGALQSGYPRLRFSGGMDATIRLTYAEALRISWDTEGAEVLGKPEFFANLSWNYADETSGWTFDRRGTVTGWCDIVRPSGEATEYSPFHWRTFRYILVEIQTADETISLHDLRYDYTGYPYRLDATFSSSEPAYDKFWEISNRTLQLCSHETFEDCPYYEQMQYTGDAVITSQLAMAIAGDYDLTRQTLYHFDWSRLPEGVTQSRYPSREQQVIPSWALHWISMVKNYYMYSGDRETIAAMRRGVLSVLEWFRDQCDVTELPARIPFWNNVDWCPWWDRGQPPGWESGPTCVISSQFVHGLREAAWIEEQVGHKGRAEELRAEAEERAKAVHRTFWDGSDGLYRDNVVDRKVSQYGQAWAIYSGVASHEQYNVLSKRFPHDSELAPVSFFGTYYVILALRQMGADSLIPPLLDPWHEMAESGLSTWAEETAYWRSLCHVWSAHPSLLFLNTVVGLLPTVPGCRQVTVAPHPLGISHAEGSICTPHGQARATWSIVDSEFLLRVELPPGVSGRAVVPSGASIEIGPEGLDERFSLDPAAR